MVIDFHRTTIPSTPCSECKAASLPLDSEYLGRYFHSVKIACSNCNAELDWWKLLLRHLEWNIPFYVYGLVGALDTLLTLKMKPNELITLDLVEVGIPPDAKILHISYTPNGKGLFPVEVHGNAPIRHFTPHKIWLYGRPLGEPEGEIPVTVSVAWVNTTLTEESWQNLIQAVEAYSIADYQRSIIPANVSVEAKLNQLMQTYLTKYASAKRVEEFLETRATYSYQLNVLLPVLTSHVHFPELPEHIRGKLNDLRNHRNDIAHKGKLEKELDKPASAQLLCAAVFGLGYMNLLEYHVSTNQ
jgi:hypothetical protein